MKQRNDITAAATTSTWVSGVMPYARLLMAGPFGIQGVRDPRRVCGAAITA